MPIGYHRMTYAHLLRERPYFSLLSLIVYTIQAPTEAVFQNLLSVLKMYSAHNENYRFSVLAVLAAKIL